MTQHVSIATEPMGHYPLYLKLMICSVFLVQCWENQMFHRSLDDMYTQAQTNRHLLTHFNLHHQSLREKKDVLLHFTGNDLSRIAKY